MLCASEDRLRATAGVLPRRQTTAHFSPSGTGSVTSSPSLTFLAAAKSKGSARTATSLEPPVSSRKPRLPPRWLVALSSDFSRARVIHFSGVVCFASAMIFCASSLDAVKMRQIWIRSLASNRARLASKKAFTSSSVTDAVASSRSVASNAER
jgi:hypothetical protein